MAPEGLLVYCRAGFEGECAQELAAAAAVASVDGFVKARPESGFAAFQAHEPEAGRKLASQVDFGSLVFARQIIQRARLVSDLPVGDRATPIAAAARELGSRFRGLLLEMPDTNDGKSLATLTRPLALHLERALAKAGVAFDDERASSRLHVFFIGGAACYVGVSDPANSSPWPLGIPRLRMPREAPSRSTLKLAEAIKVFLGADEESRMAPGMSAVDLGASPGGWTYQLTSRSMRVIAVDNGPMDARLLETGQVKHRREDGLKFRPADPVDWMVCDMVEQPSRVAALAARWVGEGWCRESIFNLKLPMRKRREEVERCRGLVEEAFQAPSHELRIHQLYHDREEVTAHLAPVARRRR